MKFLADIKPPVVSALPSPGKAGRLLSLLSDGHLYHDTGSVWEALSSKRVGLLFPQRRGDVNDPSVILCSTGGGSIGTSIVYRPFSVTRKMVLTEIGVYVFASGGPANARLGIYDNNGSGSTDVPGSLIAQSDSVLVLSSTLALITSTITCTLYPGRIYWMASTASASHGGISGIPAGIQSVPMGRRPNATPAIFAMTEANGNGVLPATAAASAYSSSTTGIWVSIK